MKNILSKEDKELLKFEDDGEGHNPMFCDECREQEREIEIPTLEEIESQAIRNKMVNKIRELEMELEELKEVNKK